MVFQRPHEICQWDQISLGQSLLRLNEFVVAEVKVCTLTRWVAHDVGVVLGWVKLLVDGSLVSLVNAEVQNSLGGRLEHP